MVHAGKYSEHLSHAAGSDGTFRVADDLSRVSSLKGHSSPLSGILAPPDPVRFGTKRSRLFVA
jgi:hypothetical protein